MLLPRATGQSGLEEGGGGAEGAGTPPGKATVQEVGVAGVAGVGLAKRTLGQGR